MHAASFSRALGLELQITRPNADASESASRDTDEEAGADSETDHRNLLLLRSFEDTRRTVDKLRTESCGLSEVLAAKLCTSYPKQWCPCIQMAATRRASASFDAEGCCPCVENGLSDVCGSVQVTSAHRRRGSTPCVCMVHASPLSPQFSPTLAALILRVNEAYEHVSDPSTSRECKYMLMRFIDAHVPLAQAACASVTFSETDMRRFEEDCPVNLDAVPSETTCPQSAHILQDVCFFGDETRAKTTSLAHLFTKCLPKHCLFRNWSEILGKYCLEEPETLESVRRMVLNSQMGGYLHALARPSMHRRVQLHGMLGTASPDQFFRWVTQHEQLVFYAFKERLCVLLENEPCLLETVRRCYHWEEFKCNVVNAMDEVRSSFCRTGTFDGLDTPLSGRIKRAELRHLFKFSVGAIEDSLYHEMEKIQEQDFVDAYRVERRRNILGETCLRCSFVSCVCPNGKTVREHFSVIDQAAFHRLRRGCVGQATVLSKACTELCRHLCNVVPDMLRSNPEWFAVLGGSRHLEEVLRRIVGIFNRNEDLACAASALRELRDSDFAVLFHWLVCRRLAKRVCSVPLPVEYVGWQIRALCRRYGVERYEDLPDHAGVGYVCHSCSTFRNPVVQAPRDASGKARPFWRTFGSLHQQHQHAQHCVRSRRASGSRRTQKKEVYSYARGDRERADGRFQYAPTEFGGVGRSRDPDGTHRAPQARVANSGLAVRQGPRTGDAMQLETGSSDSDGFANGDEDDDEYENADDGEDEAGVNRSGDAAAGEAFRSALCNKQTNDHYNLPEFSKEFGIPKHIYNADEGVLYCGKKRADYSEKKAISMAYRSRSEHVSVDQERFHLKKVRAQRKNYMRLSCERAVLEERQGVGRILVHVEEGKSFMLCPCCASWFEMQLPSLRNGPSNNNFAQQPNVRQLVCWQCAHLVDDFSAMGTQAPAFVRTSSPSTTHRRDRSGADTPSSRNRRPPSASDCFFCGSAGLSKGPLKTYTRSTDGSKVNVCKKHDRWFLHHEVTELCLTDEELCKRVLSTSKYATQSSRSLQRIHGKRPRE